MDDVKAKDIDQPEEQSVLSVNEQDPVIKDEQEYSLETGLGTGIGILSLINASKRKTPVVLHVNRPTHWSFDFIKAIRMPESKVQVKLSDIDEFMSPLAPGKLGDSVKFFSPYIDIDEVDLYGETFQLGKPDKEYKAIGILMSNGSPGTAEAKASNAHPYHRYYSKETYLKIIKLCSDAGYDIITLDSPWIDMRDKMYQISQLCDCVIGYEGGMMHLAHVLKTPTIILPWHHYAHGEPPDSFSYFGNPRIPAVEYSAHMYHLDKMSYFPTSPEQILNWKPEILKSVIKLLRQKAGNNYFLKNKLTFFEKEAYFRNHLCEFERSFIQKYVGELHVSGDPNL